MRIFSMVSKLSTYFSLLLFLSCISFASEWNVKLNARIDSDEVIATGRFIAGINDNAVDGLDGFDGRLLETPSFSIALYSIVSEENLMIDIRSTPQTWQLFHKASSDFEGLGSFTEKLSWDISSLPSNISIVLIDYGSDTTRTQRITSIYPKNQSSYTFTAQPFGIYRYFDLVASEIAPVVNIPSEQNISSQNNTQPSIIQENSQPNSEKRSQSSNRKSSSDSDSTTSFTVNREQEELPKEVAKAESDPIQETAPSQQPAIPVIVHKAGANNPLVGVGIIMVILIVGLSVWVILLR